MAEVGIPCSISVSLNIGVGFAGMDEGELFALAFELTRDPPPWARQSCIFPIATRLQPLSLHRTPPPCYTFTREEEEKG